jgi:hypothetical protein
MWPHIFLTFVAIYERILDYHRAAVCCRDLLRLAAILSEVCTILDLVVRTDPTWHPQDMARQKLLRATEISVRSVGIAVTGGQKNFGSRDQKNL